MLFCSYFFRHCLALSFYNALCKTAPYARLSVPGGSPFGRGPLAAMNMMDGKSLNITEEKIEKLKAILPEAFTEGKLDLDGNAGKQDLGFKVFKLQQSNFKIWRPKIENEEELVKQLTLHTDPVNKNAETENILYELLLKSGVSLIAKIVKTNGYYLQIMMRLP